MHWKMVNSHGYVTKGYARFHNLIPFSAGLSLCVCRSLGMILISGFSGNDQRSWLILHIYLSLFCFVLFSLSLFLSLSLSVSLFPNLIGVDLFLGLPHSTYGWLTHDQCWRRCILFGWTIWRNNNDTEQNINLHTMLFIVLLIHVSDGAHWL
jgi:hypothetical protein